MRKLLYFSIVIIVLCIVKSEDTFKHAVLEYKFSSHDLAATTHISSIRNKLYSSDNGIYVNGSVPIIYENAFQDFKNLTELNLQNTNLEEIRPGAFGNVLLLEVIELNNNKLREIKSGVFTNLEVLTLELRYNAIKVLEQSAFQNFTVLEFFSLEGNKIEEIRKEVFDNIFVRNIVLANNAISKLEAGVFDKVFPIKNTFDLGLIVDQFFKVSLENNKLKKIDREVFNNKKLSVLRLDNNKISQIQPGDLNNMPNLVTLSLSGNKLKIIPDGVFSNSNLQGITLSYNQISTIATGAFDNLRSLMFRIDHNQLTVYDPNWFHNTHTSGPDGMYFNDNLIEELPSKAFKNYQDVVFVNFTKNKIRKIASDAFSGTTKIMFMYLSENLLEKWDESIFVASDDRKIDILDLTKNKLKCFEGNLENIFASVGYVKLDGNPFEANCVEKIAKYQRDKMYGANAL